MTAGSEIGYTNSKFTPHKDRGAKMSKSMVSKQSAIYEIRIKGHLDQQRITVFENLSGIHRPDGETVLTGPMSDQAALYGVLNRLRDLGIPLVSVNQRLQEHETR